MLDFFAAIASASIWITFAMNLVLTVAGYCCFLRWRRKPKPQLPAKAPLVSIMVPAHNEGIVIVKTVEALLALDYPNYEIIVINDNSSDNSAALLQALQKAHPRRQLTVVNTDATSGGRGKANALNIGLTHAQGELIAVYDADNTPEPEALRYLVATLLRHKKLGAVIGKFRTRNKNASWLTRFINVETLTFQWMAQAGRQQLFRLCTIPGTNYVIRRSLLAAIGGWDPLALAEDTEISFQVYARGFRIQFQPLAVTWEQEPQTLDVWFHQRTRWVKGNIYVILKNTKKLFTKESRHFRFDLVYFLTIYFLLLTALLWSDVMLILSAVKLVPPVFEGFSSWLWLGAFGTFVLSTYTTITTEKGERTFSNLLVVVMMYLVYSQMWLAVAGFGLVSYLRQRLLHQQMKWYKTKRYD